MRTKELKREIQFVTLGCSKNQVDSESLMSQLSEKYLVNHQQGEDDKKLDIVVINTCGFIENAKQESIDTIIHYIALKKEKKLNELYVMGCLVERYKKDLQNELGDDVDNFYGTQEYLGLLKRLKINFKKELIGERTLSTPSHFAYLKISEGCDKKCAFCAIPLMRGAFKSKPIEEIFEETKKLTEKGVVEVMLIAQELTFYGMDLYRKRALVELLQKLSTIESLKWIRLHYAYPTNFPKELLDEIANNPKVCNYLDIPFQHFATSVLKTMRRGGTLETQLRLIKEIKEKVPNITLRTTILVGYPTETEKEFEILCDVIEQVKFDRLGVFKYSHEEDTHAYENYGDDVPEEVKEDRYQRVMEIQSDISYEKNQSKIGKEIDVLIDEKIDEGYLSRSEGDSHEVDNTVFIQTKENLKIGNFIKVKIVDADIYDLVAEVV